LANGKTEPLERAGVIGKKRFKRAEGGKKRQRKNARERQATFRAACMADKTKAKEKPTQLWTISQLSTRGSEEGRKQLKTLKKKIVDRPGKVRAQKSGPGEGKVGEKGLRPEMGGVG